MALLSIESRGYIPLSNPPAQTNAGENTALSFVSAVDAVYIQNNTGVSVNVNIDAPATPGSLVISPGSTLVYHKECSTVNLFTASPENINGTIAGNIVVLGAE